MKKISNKRSELKREIILNNAYTVFSKKGFISVTMKDIIDECSISRGGIYLYFRSIDDIFYETITQRSVRQFDDIRSAIQNNPVFEDIFRKYLLEQKIRLIDHINHNFSLLRAMYEYSFTHTLPRDEKLKIKQTNATRATVRSLLDLGVKQNKIKCKNIKTITDNFMFLIEGMNILALTGQLNEKQIDNQFDLFIDQLFL